MKIRYPLAVAAAVAATGLAPAQQFQVQVKPARLVEPTAPASPDGKAPPTEFKPSANTDPDPKSLAVPEDLQKKAKELVGKLGSPVYAEREKATRELAKMGRMALPALQEAIGSAAEPEVAQRCEGLLPKAEAEDMKARVGCFLADAEGKFQHTLPGWDKFKVVTGNDKASRKLFAELLKSSITHQMLLAAEKTADEANGVLNQYVTRLWESQNGFRRGGFGGEIGNGQPAKLPDLVAALFLESQFTDKEVIVQATIPWGWGGGGNQSVANYVYNVPEVSNAIYSGSGEYSGPIRKILIQWMDTRETTHGAYQAYNFANSIFQNDRKKSLKYAAKVLEGESGPNTSYNKLNILNMLANQQKDARDLVPSIAKSFDDSLMIWNWQNGNPGFDIQLRDYALAFAIQLTDQKPEDYGMSRTNANSKDKTFSQQAFYFKDDNPPKNNPGGGVVVRPGRGRAVPVEAEDPKKEEPKKEDPKDPKKEENKKLSQEDRRKAAYKKWDEWVKTNVGVGEKEDPVEARKKWEAWAATPPKKDDKKPEAKPDDKKPEAKPKPEPKKDEPKKEELKKEEAKKEAATAEQEAKQKEEAAKKEAEQKALEKKKEDEKK